VTRGARQPSIWHRALAGAACLGAGLLVIDGRIVLGVAGLDIEFGGPALLALFALVVAPVVAVVLVVMISLASGHDISSPPLELVVPVIGLSCGGAGLAALKIGAAPASHGWWMLGGGLSGLFLFGMLAGATG
jgi:hypothetical protein